jgi:hypothetical protein
MGVSAARHSLTIRSFSAVVHRRRRDRRLSPASRDLCQGPRLRGVARSHTSSKIDRQQAEAQCDIQMGERTLRRLLIIGSSAVVKQANKRGAPKGSRPEQMLVRKPRMLVTVVLANKMVRIAWGLLRYF